VSSDEPPVNEPVSGKRSTTQTTAAVFLMGDRLDVIRVRAEFYPAEMVRFRKDLSRTVDVLIGEPMDRDDLTDPVGSSPADFPITMFRMTDRMGTGAGPDPAAGFQVDRELEQETLRK